MFDTAHLGLCSSEIFKVATKSVYPTQDRRRCHYQLSYATYKTFIILGLILISSVFECGKVLGAWGEDFNFGLNVPDTREDYIFMTANLEIKHEENNPIIWTSIVPTLFNNNYSS